MKCTIDLKQRIKYKIILVDLIGNEELTNQIMKKIFYPTHNS